MTFGGAVWYLGAFLVALGLLVIVHELGHFVAATLCRVKILRFSVGFGRPLWSRRFGRDGTEWSLAMVPLGGYVKMLDEREGPVAAEELPRAFNRQSVWRRAIIVFCGPLANFLLAVLIYSLLFMHGTQELRPLLGQPPAGSAAAAAGIQAGEIVRAVSGVPVQTLQDLRWELTQRVVERQPVTLELANERGNLAFRTLDVSRLDANDLDRDVLDSLGLRLFRPPVPPVVGKVATATVAETAGLRSGDEIVAVDDQAITSGDDLVRIIRAAPGRQLHLQVKRGERRLDVWLTPATEVERGKEIGRIGISVGGDGRSYAALMVEVRYGPVAAMARAVRQTWETASFSLRLIGQMIVGELSWKNLSGPVTIADYAGQSASMGATAYLKFLALISISLGVLNLLPIPILDGGHLMYYLVEVIKGGPLSERAMEIGQQIGLGLLVLLMAFAFYNDINRLVSG